jgi:hypothetical protein
MATPAAPGQVNGKATTDNTTPATRAPRRLVLLAADQDSSVERVLAEYPGEEARKVHQEVQRLAVEHPGRVVAVEWLGPLGWTRFLWCRK